MIGPSFIDGARFSPSDLVAADDPVVADAPTVAGAPGAT
jgi:hypothetical protein